MPEGDHVSKLMRTPARELGVATMLLSEEL